MNVMIVKGILRLKANLEAMSPKNAKKGRNLKMMFMKEIRKLPTFMKK